MGLCSHHKAALAWFTSGPPQLLKEQSVVDSYQVGEQAATTGCTIKHGAQPVHGRAQCTGCKAIINSTTWSRCTVARGLSVHLQSEVDPLRKGCELLPEFNPKAWLARPS